MNHNFDFVLLKNSEEFEKYKEELDNQYTFEKVHYGSPEEYPCVVASQLSEYIDSESEFAHFFLYNLEKNKSVFAIKKYKIFSDK